MDFYSLIKSCTGFDWDEGNRDKNELKHGVSQEECESVFMEDPIIAFDQNHSIKEIRLVIFGRTFNDRLLSVFFTIRGKKIRVISARDQSKKEKIKYLKIINDNDKTNT